MNVHFFAFTSLPDMIVRKNYTRKQFELLSKLLISVKQQYLTQRAAEEAMNADETKKEKDSHNAPKTDANVITEEDLVEIQLLDDFLVSHQRSFDHKKSLWLGFIQRAKDDCREKLDSLKEQKPTEKQKKLIEQYVFSNMLNTALEKNHEEMLEFHFKHELMEAQLYRNKHKIISPQALMASMKLILGCDDPNYKIKLGSSPLNDPFGSQYDDRFSPQDRMMARSNLWGETIEMPLGHSYSN